MHRETGIETERDRARELAKRRQQTDRWKTGRAGGIKGREMIEMHFVCHPLENVYRSTEIHSYIEN